MAGKAGKSKSSMRLDFATLAGVVLALGGVIGGLLLEKGNINDIAQLTAAMIVLGGTFGAVLVTTPMKIVFGAVRGLKNIILEPSDHGEDLVARILQFATDARKNGIVSLEQQAGLIDDPFLRKAMSLAIDGAELQDLRRMMEVDIDVIEQRAEAEAKVWEAAGGYAPTVGIIGAVLGLIQVMKHLEDIHMVGHGIAVAFVATVYGVASANFVFLPFAAKMRARLRDGIRIKEMVLEGVSGIAQGVNPTLLRMKLESYCPEAEGKAGKGGRGSGASRAKEAA
jgi:chemotaxis protein MotA